MEITPKELKTRLDRGETLQLLDVREIEEYQFANIGGMNIPLSDLSARYQELDRALKTVVICHHGHRSAQATILLARLGFIQVLNLRGGIDLWSTDVDATVPKY